MKKNVLFFIITLFIVFSGGRSTAQVVPSISETFDVACVTSPYNATGWKHYNPLPATMPAGAWTCTTNEGNHNTPGMKCTGYYSGVFNTDTSYLITPEMNVSAYTGNVYLRFDSKTSKVYLGSKLSVFAATHNDTGFYVPAYDTDVTPGIIPVIGEPDSSGWVTHEVNITPLKGYGNFYLAFRYVSNDSSGSVWYLDNINTDTASMTLDVTYAIHNGLQLSVIGVPSASGVLVSYTVPEAGVCSFTLYDMMGREISRQEVQGGVGTSTFKIDAPLARGMYCLKLSNKTNYIVTKVLVP